MSDQPTTKHSVPVIDISPLRQAGADLNILGEALKKACREYGFFYIKEHGISEKLQEKLEKLSAAFFALNEAEKMKISMAKGGKAWRGFFPVGDELTSGKPDMKEGLYFGTELGPDHPKVQAGLPLHGANLFPDSLPEFKETVGEYMQVISELGHQLMRGLAVSLDLSEDYFAERYTTDPLTLFRIFHYPPSTPKTLEEELWGVGEHTDYGVLTILKQDSIGGLQVKSKNQWIEAPYIPGTFICNIGDMLDRMTSGYYRSTPHRVLNKSGKSRYSYPFFFDPNFDTEIRSIDLGHVEVPEDDKAQRWDGTSIHEFKGTYGDYVLGKVSKVFPHLKREVGN